MYGFESSSTESKSVARNQLIKKTEYDWELTTGINVMLTEIKFNSTRNCHVEHKANYSRAVGKD